MALETTDAVPAAHAGDRAAIADLEVIRNVIEIGHPAETEQAVEEEAIAGVAEEEIEEEEGAAANDMTTMAIAEGAPTMSGVAFVEAAGAETGAEAEAGLEAEDAAMTGTAEAEDAAMTGTVEACAGASLMARASGAPFQRAWQSL